MNTCPLPLLLLDIGNTNTKIGVLQGSEILATYSLPTRLDSTADQWGLQVVQILGLHNIVPQDVAGWVVCSVVPPLSAMISKAGQRFCHCPVLFVPEDLPVPLENRYARAHEVGADRLMAAYAARQSYSARSLIVVDFGTATTFDCIQDNAYLGGLICPGLHSSAAALATKTAKLPSVDLDAADCHLRIGQSTAQSLRHGMVFGFAAMVDGLCVRLRQQLVNPVDVVVTGGPASSMIGVCTGIDHHRPDLLMRGLAMISLENTHILRKGAHV